MTDDELVEAAARRAVEILDERMREKNLRAFKDEMAYWSARTPDVDPTTAHGGEPMSYSMESQWAQFNRNTPEAFWDAAGWTDTNWLKVSIDVADRKRIVMAVLAATLPQAAASESEATS